MDAHQTARRRQVHCTARHFEKRIMPFFGNGVPLAVAAAHASLRLSAETYRAEDDLAYSPTKQSLLTRSECGNPTEEFNPGVYEAKFARRCGVRVGPLIMVRHVTHRDYLTARDEAILGEVYGTSSDRVWRPSSTHMPPVPSYNVADAMNPYHSVKASADAAPLHVSPSCTPAHGADRLTEAAEILSRTTYGSQHPREPLVDATEEWNASRIGDCVSFGTAPWAVRMRQVVEQKRCAVAAMHERWEREAAPTGGPQRRREGATNDETDSRRMGPDEPRLLHASQRESVAGAGVSQPSSLRILYLWTEGVHLPQGDLETCFAAAQISETGTERTSKLRVCTAVAEADVPGAKPEKTLSAKRQDALKDLVSYSLWWLLRPSCPHSTSGAASSTIISPVLSTPTRLHAFSKEAASLQTVCRALCETMPCAEVDVTKWRELFLEGLVVQSYPPWELKLGHQLIGKARREPGLWETHSAQPFFTPSVLSRLQYLRITSCNCPSAAVRTILYAPPPNPTPLHHQPCDEHQPSGNAVSSVSIWTPTPQLHTVDFSGVSDINSLPLLDTAPKTSSAFPGDAALRAHLIPGVPVLAYLTVLNLRQTGITDATLSLLGQCCSSLRVLIVAQCRALTTLNGLARHPATGVQATLVNSLTYLDASFTQVNDAGIAEVACLVALITVKLSHCSRLTDITPLAKLPRLRELALLGVMVREGLQAVVTRTSLEKFAHHPFRETQTPFLSAAQLDESRTDPAACVGPSRRFHALTSLTLIQVAGFTNDSLRLLTLAGAPLESLVLCSVNNLTSLAGLGGDVPSHRSLPDIPLHRTLHTLHLQYNLQLSMDGMQVLKTLGALQRMLIMGCDRLTSMGDILVEVPWLRALLMGPAARDDADEDDMPTQDKDVGLSGYATTFRNGMNPQEMDRNALSLLYARKLELLSCEDNEDLEVVDCLAGMPHLKALSLRDTAVTTESLTRAVHWHVALGTRAVSLGICDTSSFLHSIALSYCASLTDVNCLAKLPSLRSLSVETAPLTDDGIEALLFSPESHVEHLNMTGCLPLTLAYDVPAMVTKWWGTEEQRRPCCSSLVDLTLIGLRQVTDATLATLFTPISMIRERDTTSPCASEQTFFSRLATLDLSLCRLVRSMTPLRPLAPSLRSLALRGTLVDTEAVAQLHAFTTLESLDLQDTTRICHLDTALTHPNLRRLNLNGMVLCSSAEDEDPTVDDAFALGCFVETNEANASHEHAEHASSEQSQQSPCLTSSETAMREDAPHLTNVEGHEPQTGQRALMSERTVQSMSRSRLEVIYFSLDSELFERVIAPLILYDSPLRFTADGADLCAVATSRSLADAVDTSTRAPRLLPQLGMLRYGKSLTTIPRWSPGVEISPDSRHDLAARIQATRPLLSFRRF